MVTNVMTIDDGQHGPSPTPTPTPTPTPKPREPSDG